MGMVNHMILSSHHPVRKTATTAAWLVALAVLTSACSGATSSSDPAVAEDVDPQASGVSEVQVVATDLAFQPTDLTTTAGPTTVVLDNQGALEHDVVILETDAVVARAPGGSTDSGTVDLEPGTYTFYCSVTGHREAGMEGTLVVET